MAKVQVEYASLKNVSGSGAVDLIFSEIQSEINSLETSLTDDGITLFEIRFGDSPSSPSLPIRIKLPEGVLAGAKEKILETLGNLRTLIQEGTETDVWE